MTAPSGTECPTCGRDGFKSTRGMRTHHKRTHGESLVARPTGDIECPTCGIQKFRSTRGLEIHHARMHGETLGLLEKDISCDHCGREFKRKECRIGENNFCSPECRTGWTRESDVLKGENNPGHKPKVELECKNCSEIYKVKPYHEDRSSFCSKDCLGEWMSENYQGENNPFYRESQYSRKGFTNRMKREVRERDGKKCVSCGTSQAEHIENRGTKLHVHHIIPIIQFDDPEDAHHMDNLITLCYKCHKKWEKMAGLRPITD